MLNNDEKQLIRKWGISLDKINQIIKSNLQEQSNHTLLKEWNMIN